MWGQFSRAGFVLLLVVSFLLVSLDSVAAQAKVQIASAEKVIQLSDEDEEMVVLDARGAKDRRTGHIRWSQGITSKQLNGAFLENVVASKNTVVVFYGDRDSKLAATGAKIAIQAGYTDVYWLKGGWQEWQSKGLRLDQ